MAQAPRSEEWLSATMAAKVTGVHRRTLQRWTRAQRIRGRLVEGTKLIEVGEVLSLASTPRVRSLRGRRDPESPATPPPASEGLPALAARVDALVRRMDAVERYLGTPLPAPPAQGGAPDPDAPAGRTPR